MIWVIGEYLMDLFPGYQRPGGAPFNFAFHLSKMGLQVRLISRVGRDHTGEKLIEYASRQGLNLSHIQIDGNHGTGRVNVTLDKRGIPDFHIVPETAYDFIDFADLLRDDTPIELVYFGTLIQRTKAGRERLDVFLSAIGKRCRLFCDLNLRPGCYSDQVILDSLKRADILKLNDGELETIRGVLGDHRKNDLFLKNLSERFHIETIAVTRGEKGSLLYHQGHFQTISADELDQKRPVTDTVGAGDAYAAVLAFGCLHGWPSSIILRKASRLASEICSVPGAIPEDDRVYIGITEPIREERP